MTQLSEHFSLQELAESETAVRCGIDNTPPAAMEWQLKTLAAGMEHVRAILGAPVSISSGYRCEELERLLCAKDFAAWCRRNAKMTLDPAAWQEYFARKAHPKGYACDFSARKFCTPDQIVAKLSASSLRFDQLICEGTWVHISFDPRLRRQVLNATFTNGSPQYTQRG